MLLATVERAEEEAEGPIVVAYGINWPDLMDAGGLPAEVVDGEEGRRRLVAELEKHLRSTPGLASVQCVELADDSECLGAQYTCSVDETVDLQTLECAPWELLEALPYSSVYDDDPDDLPNGGRLPE